MVTIQWNTEEVSSFQTEDIFKIEEATSLYFSALLADKSHSAFQDSSEVISTSVKARKQKVGSDYVILESVVDVMNIGDEGVMDAAALLMFLTNKNTTNSSFTHLDSLIDIDFKIDMISFTNEKKSSQLVLPVQKVTEPVPIDESKYSSKEKTLITVTSILAFALFAVSAILIWVAGGWLALRKQVKILIHREEELSRRMGEEIKQKATQDTEDEEAVSPTSRAEETQFTNPSGILGVNPYYKNAGIDPFRPGAMEGLGVKMTPARGLRNKEAEMFTPMSDATMYSDTGRAPLGITSMRKLIPGRDNGGATSPTAGQRNSLEAFGMKKLNYGGSQDGDLP